MYGEEIALVDPAGTTGLEAGLSLFQHLHRFEGTLKQNGERTMMCKTLHY